ncbi:N-acetylmuramic acid 6-phosphate etherase [Mycoplasmopsis pullorum]|uniref:N-acetylmuramic acid 6-phosphate etherase n=1 Tax=Mycoplasmopsis pullorum TaxID=48003 RepID=UPI001118E608|nr:N-acetylmuramic acid 6-phosphate etherase [Mycoplasmopsis pullorum]TNK81669.1 N-acetylmuramic acid 6-phosphate etherase [Mycoplasmopsis pullorum]TNK81940.1 N-acetylmuramic acid 6-phosphate etherase [Mycoplasmopsis pullorum]TNK84018.1 N-acetylmuramic acid 6-phosphate etherase [Mycoplasmopsis pullorum]TNK84697.1 N-acetylmuramic acid 6-phosphate etherase [Mycoplasmopsis pullorum]TNK85351.1 N-acetylmuramic acid 6-phosphate etherase [Mycoplasmopsis pullorum]
MKKELDQMSILELIDEFDSLNYQTLKAIEEKRYEIEKICELSVSSIKSNGCVIYVGAGTSGRIALLDSIDVWPTFGENNWFKYSMAGGGDAVLKSLEGNEDNLELGFLDAQKMQIKENDLIIGLSASGNTRYVFGFMQFAKQVKAKTVLITNKQNGICEELSDLVCLIQLGDEIIQGSTRLRAGDAQKMILNKISTITAIKMNKVYDNLMIDLKPINKKLINRSIEIISRITNVPIELAQEYYEKSNNDMKLACIMIVKNVSYEESKLILEQSNHNLRKSLE